LTKNGELQISSSAEKVVGPGKIIDPALLAHVFISPRTRARRTYELLFDGPSRQMLEGRTEITEDIREWEYGMYEGLLTAQIRKGRSERGLDTERPWNICRYFGVKSLPILIEFMSTSLVSGGGISGEEYLIVSETFFTRQLLTLLSPRDRWL
jgi:broad specificity phosphatase PhoE